MEVNVPPIVKVPIVFAPELVTFPVKFPVTFPAVAASMDVALIVPFTSNACVGVAVPIPTLAFAPSIVITVVVTPPSFTLKIMSVSAIVFDMFAPLPSTVIVKSASTPTMTPPSFATDKVPDVVSLAFDLR